MKKDFIPHQLGLAKNQAKKLLTGGAVIIPHSMMGSAAGDHILMLKPQNARKLLTAYTKGRGLKLSLTPDEIQHTLEHGRGFKEIYHSVSRVVKNALGHPAVRELAKSGVRYGANAIGVAAGSALGSPEAGHAIGAILGSAADSAIDNRSVAAGRKRLVGDVRQKGEEIAYDALESNIKKLPTELRAPAQAALAQQSTASLGFGIKNHHYTTRKGDKVHHIKDHYVIEDSSPYSGGRLKKGSEEAKAFMAAIRNKKAGGKINIKNIFKKAAHYVIPAATASLGAATGSALGGPIGGIAGSAAGSYAGHEIDKKLGIGIRKRGRPRKVGGALASSSAAYRQALRTNFDGLELVADVPDNRSTRDFKINPRVRVSSTEMTLSPYQNITSPAMNPFIPTNYRQMGGSGSGYGGSGLYGSSSGKGLFGSNA